MDYHSTPRNRLSSYRTYSTNSSSSGPLTAPVSRPRSQLSREGGGLNTKETANIASEFLRSALERERASRRTNLDHNDGVVQSSPTRAATADPSRHHHRHRRTDSNPSHTGGEGYSTMGAKEASETISRLNNDNFNLKLEVYHRREREAALEDRVQKLENGMAARDEREEALRTEILTRETEIKQQTAAVQEAVNVIMDLEMKLAKYKQGEPVDEEENDDAVPTTPTPGLPSGQRGPWRLEDDITALARMPSFVSELSANTENLRNVYLNSHGSAVNLMRGDAGDVRGQTYTPSLTILDEIYGDTRLPKMDPSFREQTPARELRELPAHKTKQEKRHAIEKALSGVPLSHRQPRFDKRDALHPVLTGVPIGRDALPPTPDTMTSSTLERGSGRGSKDTLAHQPSIPEAAEPEREPHRPSLSNPSAAPSVSAFNDRRGYAEPTPRPRSASEATTTPRWDMSDTDSMESDVDIWLRERGRASPDLFSIAAPGPGWESNQMFGISTATSTLTQGQGPPPPPPHRRSSLQAHTSTPGRPRTRGTPSVIRQERYNDFFDNRMGTGATPPPIQLKRSQMDALPQPDDGGVSLKASVSSNSSSVATAAAQAHGNGGAHVMTAPNTPTGPPTPNSTNHKRRWFGLGRVGSLRKGMN